MSVRVVFLGFLGQEVCRWEGSLIINKPVWYAEVFFVCVCVCGLLFREKHLSNFILHASIRHLLFSLTVRTVRAAVFNSDPDNGISEPRLCIMFTLKWADNAGFRSCRSKCVNSHVFNRLPRGDREEISDAYSARDESSDYPVCWSPLIQPHAHACAPGACASRTRVWKWLEKTVHFEGALIRLSMIKKKLEGGEVAVFERSSANSQFQVRDCTQITWGVRKEGGESEIRSRGEAISQP